LNEYIFLKGGFNNIIQLDGNATELGISGSIIDNQIHLNSIDFIGKTMKKIILLLTTLFITANIYSNNIGFGGNIDIDSNFYEKDDYAASYVKTIIEPFVRIELSETTFIEPFISVAIETEKDEDSYKNSVEDDLVTTTIAFGSSIGKSAYKNKLFSINYGLNAELSFGLEPTGDSATEYASYADVTFLANGFISLDLNLTENLKVRLNHNILQFNSNYTTYEEVQSAIYTDMSYSLDCDWSGFNPTFSIYYML